MDFRILGPLLVEVDGAPVQLGPKLRAVLTLLLLHANRAVPAAEVRAVLGATGRTPTIAQRLHHLSRIQLPQHKSQNRKHQNCSN